MSFFGLGTKQSVRDENQGLIVYLDKELQQQREIRANIAVSCQNILKELQGYQQAHFSQIISSLGNSDPQQNNLGLISTLVLMIKNQKQKDIIVRRVVGPSENPLQIIKNKPENIEYYFIFNILQNSEYSTSKSILNLVNPLYDMLSQNNQFQRAGILEKMSKKGSFKQRHFKLFKQHITYTQENKKECIKYIPLESAKVDRLGKEQNMFQITGGTKRYRLKATSQMDMMGWLQIIVQNTTYLSQTQLLYELDQQIQSMERRSSDLFVQQFLQEQMVSFNKNICNNHMRKNFFAFITMIQKRERQFNSVSLKLIERYVQYQSLSALQKVREGEDILKSKNELILRYLQQWKFFFGGRKLSLEINETPQKIQAQKHSIQRDILKSPQFEMLLIEQEESQRQKSEEIVDNFQQDCFCFFEFVRENDIRYKESFNENNIQQIMENNSKLSPKISDQFVLTLFQYLEFKYYKDFERSGFFQNSLIITQTKAFEKIYPFKFMCYTNPYTETEKEPIKRQNTESLSPLSPSTELMWF